MSRLVNPGGQYEYVTPSRRRSTTFPYGYVRSIPCPQCGVVALEKCVNPQGGITGDHVARRRMATRKWYADQEARGE